MLKQFMLTVIVVLLLSACNLTGEEPTPDPVVVENIVAMTLTAEHQQNEEKTPTPLVLSPTEPEQTATNTVLPTDTPENTATSTPSQTITVTETPPPTGIKDTLGSPDWSNTLDNGNAFGLDSAGYEDEITRIFIENGAMVLSNSSSLGFRGWRLTVKSPDNIYLEAEFEVTSCAGQDLYGLVFRAPDYESGRGYYLGVTCEGRYNVTKWVDSGMQTVLSTTDSIHIKAGTGQTNLVGIQMAGNSFTIYINNALVTQFTDTAFAEGGHFGVFIAGQSPGAFTIRMEEIAYWTLE